ncbi:MAG: response regulator transcription factor [Bacilli bacterium]
MMKLLIVDDEKLIRDVITEYAKNEKFETLEAEDGKEALEIIKNNEIDLVVLDIMMPKMDGLTFLKEMKKINNIPVIILSARTEEYDKLTGFDLGTDDYLTKPFSPKELIARIKAILKRCGTNLDNMYVYEDLTINYDAHSVYIDNKELKLTPKEYELLCHFVKNKNIALSREQLLSNLWGYDFFGDDRTVDTHIKMLRNNLGKYRDLIITVRGVGYKFVTDKN